MAIEDLRQQLIAPLEAQDWSAAEVLSRQIIAHPQSNLADRHNLVTVLRQLGRNRETLSIRQEIAASPHASSYDLDGLCWLLLESNKPMEARPYCERAVELEPGNWAALVYTGHTYLLVGDTATAQSWYRKAMSWMRSDADIKDGPLGDFEFFISNGWQVPAVQATKNWMEQTWAKLVPMDTLPREVILHSGKFERTWAQLVSLYTLLAETDEDAKTKGKEAEYADRLEQGLRQAIDLWGNDSSLARQLARRYLQLSLKRARAQPDQIRARLDQSQQVVSPVLQVDEVAMVFMSTALAWVSGKQAEPAIPVLAHVMELRPNDAKAVYWRGIAKENLKDFSGAIADYTRALELDSNLVDAVIRRGRSREQVKEFPGALADYTRAMALDPNDGFNAYSRGSLKAKLADYSGATADYELALSQGSVLILRVLVANDIVGWCKLGKAPASAIQVANQASADVRQWISLPAYTKEVEAFRSHGTQVFDSLNSVPHDVEKWCR